MKHRFFFFTFSGKGKEEDDFTYEQNPKYIYTSTDRPNYMISHIPNQAHWIACTFNKEMA